MCMFTRPVEQVKDTNIFARLEPGGRQVLVYGMYMAGREDVAMILPLPVPPKPGETAVSFIDLSNYPTFLNGLWYGFDHPQPGDFLGCTAPGKGLTSLPVVQVGRFEASFVPSVGDFARIDERFRLPAGTWDGLPAYRDYGFAVFKLKPGAQRVHPMAFTFPTRKPMNSSSPRFTSTTEKSTRLKSSTITSSARRTNSGTGRCRGGGNQDDRRSCS
ncbi:MAG: hypothetical protein HC841_07790 [Verrucomicrobiae bacterium]|nr:hypothetical protein [Verrucomicrobiae bacterium]